MLTYVEGDLFKSPAQTLVNTVNTVGVMGKGVALRFKQIYPNIFRAYQEACRTGAIGIGRPWLYRTPHKWILNVPTKRHWRSKSDLSYIEQSLATFARTYSDEGISSIAFPALGCGNGELPWESVRPVMEKYLRLLPIDVFIYPPHKRAEMPEHRVPDAIRQWLRSEPSALPSQEVWDDIVAIARQQYGKVERLEAFLDDDEQPAEVVSWMRPDGTPMIIGADEVDALWAVFRQHGFLARPAVDMWFGDRASDVWMVLERLGYVETVVTSNPQGTSARTLQLRLPIAGKASDPVTVMVSD